MINRAMTNEQILRYAPSVFATRPSEKTSAKYDFVPTVDVIDFMRGEGWDVVSAYESRTRDEARQGFQKHALRLRHQRDIGRTLAVDDLINEITLSTAHDGTAAFAFDSSIYRCFCDNQCVTSLENVGRYKVKHKDLEEGEVMDAVYSIVEDTPKITSNIQEMRALPLGIDAKMALAKGALELKWPSENANGEKLNQPVTADQLLQVRRYADKSPDLWTTYNVIQENIIRGGLRGRTATNRRRRTRGVSSVNEDLRLNRALWHMANELKGMVG